MFAPIDNSNLFVSGILYDKNHIPMPGQKVVLTTSGHTFQTVSDKKGAYKFFGLSPVIETRRGTLSVGGSNTNHFDRSFLRGWHVISQFQDR